MFRLALSQHDNGIEKFVNQWQWRSRSLAQQRRSGWRDQTRTSHGRPRMCIPPQASTGGSAWRECLCHRILQRSRGRLRSTI